jgi:hypothetical protein
VTGGPEGEVVVTGKLAGGYATTTTRRLNCPDIVFKDVGVGRNSLGSYRLVRNSPIGVPVELKLWGRRVNSYKRPHFANRPINFYHTGNVTVPYIWV